MLLGKKDRKEWQIISKEVAKLLQDLFLVCVAKEVAKIVEAARLWPPKASQQEIEIVAIHAYTCLKRS